MTWSGRVGSGSGWVGLVRNFVCNFRVGSGFFEFRVKYFGPCPARHLVGSGRVVFFSDGLGRVYQIDWPMIRPSLVCRTNRTLQMLHLHGMRLDFLYGARAPLPVAARG